MRRHSAAERVPGANIQVRRAMVSQDASVGSAVMSGNGTAFVRSRFFMPWRWSVSCMAAMTPR
jgi:hypothetical protein